MLCNTIQIDNNTWFCKDYCTILDFVRTIALNILRSLKIIYKYYVAPLPTAFTLENTKIHVSILNSYDKTFYVKALINDFFCRWTILWIPNINLHNSHIKIIFILLKTWVALMISFKIFKSIRVFVFLIR